MSDLAEFLLARIAEDEQAAWRVRPPESGRVDPEGCGCTDCLVGYSRPADDVKNPRLLAECEVKRRIVAEAATAWVGAIDPSEPEGDEWRLGRRWGWHEVVKFLAVPYAGHPDYRQEWKP